MSSDGPTAFSKKRHKSCLPSPAGPCGWMRGMADKEQTGLILSKILLKNRAPATPAGAYPFSQLHSLWILDRYAVVQGKLWRVLSCHLVHFTPTYLVYIILEFITQGSILPYPGEQNFVTMPLCHLAGMGGVPRSGLLLSG